MRHPDQTDVEYAAELLWNDFLAGRIDAIDQIQDYLLVVFDDACLRRIAKRDGTELKTFLWACSQAAHEAVLGWSDEQWATHFERIRDAG